MVRSTISARAVIVACLSVLAFAGALAPTADAKAKGGKKLSSAQLQRLVTPKGINAHLKKLQRIASAYGGNRFAGAPGYDASAQYVFDTLKAAGYKPRFDEFDFPSFTEDEPTVFAQTAPTPTAYEDGVDYAVLEYGGTGDVTGALVAAANVGCDPADFAAGSADQVAFVKRGSCTFRQKVTNAAAAGYGAIVISNNEPGVLNGTLGAEEGQAAIPGVGISQELGDALRSQLANGPVEVTINAMTTVKTVTTRNVIAETKGGNAHNIVMIGAHLDSVDAGPGINDNGSGSAGILEIARQIARTKATPRNKLRFAWWSAEESGLVGSTDYVSRLTPEQQLDIGLYLNFDMIGSPNFARFIYDGDNTLGSDVAIPPGSDAIEANFTRFFSRRNLASEPTAFDGRSDYGPFIDIGIPSGGLFTGAEEVKTAEQQRKYGGTAGVAFDPNYHQAGDTFANVNQQAIDEQSDAIADSVALYANDTSSVDDQDQGARRPGLRGSAPRQYQGPFAVR